MKGGNRCDQNDRSHEAASKRSQIALLFKNYRNCRPRPSREMIATYTPQSRFWRFFVVDGGRQATSSRLPTQHLRPAAEELILRPISAIEVSDAKDIDSRSRATRPYRT